MVRKPIPREEPTYYQLEDFPKKDGMLCKNSSKFSTGYSNDSCLAQPADFTLVSMEQWLRKWTLAWFQ